MKQDDFLLWTLPPTSVLHIPNLDKNPGVRPIGVGEVVRRIIAKAVLSIIGPDIQRAAGPLQLCAGQNCGVEAAIHSMMSIFDDEKSEGFYLLMPVMLLIHLTGQ